MMALKIEFGKHYRTRSGRHVGPMRGIIANAAWEEGKGGMRDHEWNAETGEHHNGYGMTADDDLIAEWTDEATPPVDLTAIREPFGLLDAATQEALKAHGGPYEYFGTQMNTQGWADVGFPAWSCGITYRVKPSPPAPKVETVTHDWNTAYGFYGDDGADDPKTTHRITFDLIDGEPDCASVRMVKL